MTLLDVLLLFTLGLAIALLYACNEDRKDYRDNYYSVCGKFSEEELRCKRLQSKLTAAAEHLEKINSQSEVALLKINKDQA